MSIIMGADKVTFRCPGEQFEFLGVCVVCAFSRSCQENTLHLTMVVNGSLLVTR